MSNKPKTLRKLIPVDEAIAGRRKDAAQMTEYNALVSLVLKARAAPGLTQSESAKRMNTTQAFVARLESGRSMRSMRILSRFAEVTGHRLKISFERDVG